MTTITIEVGALITLNSQRYKQAIHMAELRNSDRGVKSSDVEAGLERHARNCLGEQALLQLLKIRRGPSRRSSRVHIEETIPQISVVTGIPIINRAGISRNTCYIHLIPVYWRTEKPKANFFAEESQHLWCHLFRISRIAYGYDILNAKEAPPIQMCPHRSAIDNNWVIPEKFKSLELFFAQGQFP